MPVGAQGHVGVRREASFASGGTIDNWQSVDSVDIQRQVNIAYGTRIQNTAEQVGAIFTNRGVSGSLTFGVTPQNPQQWWAAAIGQTASPYTVQRPIASLMMQVSKNQAAFQVSGCMVTEMTLGSQSGQELKCTVNLEGVDMASVTAGTPSYTSGDVPYVHEEADIRLNGTTNNDVTSWNMRIQNNNVTDLYGTARTRQDIPATKLLVAGSYTKLFLDNLERNRFLADLPSSFRAIYTRGSRSWDINVNKITYDNRQSPIGSQTEYILETFNWTGYVDDPSTENSVSLTVDTT